MRHLLKNIESTRGFTIIEVVIVLAIAGLIFAVVFVAVPQLQAAQRDSARQDSFGRFEAAVNQWSGRHAGDVPTRGEVDNEIIGNYLEEFADPIGGDYQRSHASDMYNNGVENGVFWYGTGYVCRSHPSRGNWVTRSGAGQRNWAVMYKVEQGGPVLCRDNS